MRGGLTSQDLILTWHEWVKKINPKTKHWARWIMSTKHNCERVEWCRCTVCLKASCRIAVIKATLWKCTYWKHQCRDGAEQQHSRTLIWVCWIYKDAAECTAGVFKPQSFDWQVSCWRPRAAAAAQPWIEIRKWVISASVAEGYSKGNPSPRSSPTTTLSPSSHSGHGQYTHSYPASGTPSKERPHS